MLSEADAIAFERGRNRPDANPAAAPIPRGCTSWQLEKRACFRSAWLPYALVAPQIVGHAGVLLLAGGQALYQSFQMQDAFGGNLQFVGLDNFRELFNDAHYLASFKVTAIFSVLVAGLGLSISLLLAAFADRVVRGARVYKTLLIWPYAVAPAIAGVLWVFLFKPTLGIIAYWLHQRGHRLELPAERRPGDAAGGHRRGLEADQLQLPVLPRRPAVDPEVADRGRGDRRRRAGQALRRPSSSRCCRRPRSSCWSSTSSTPSSTPSA